jgi:hypothetical protein
VIEPPPLRTRPYRSAILAALFVLALGATAPAKPLRHLVYAFTWGTNTDLQMQNSGMTENGGTTGSGTSDFSGETQDRGTITVDVMREQTDRGLVISVSEQAQGQRSALATTCVVFGNTNVVCDPNGKVNAEEVAVVRLLRPAFVDPTQLDAKQHWHVSQDAPDFTTVSDFVIAQNAAGVMKIIETRTVKGTGARPYTRSVSATIGYDFNRTIPTSINEDTIERSEGVNQYRVVKSQTTLQLESDSMAARP